MTTASSANGKPPSDAPSAARYYHGKRGWVPVPVKIRGKECFARGWPDWNVMIVDVDQHFPAGSEMNVGVSLGSVSGGLTDVDLDCPEAVAAADVLLPPTGLRFGRSGRRGSHRLYRTSLPSREFEDTVGGGMVLEIRTDGRQTIFPPSTHDTGDRIEWETFAEPAAPARDADLEIAARMTAAAALLARYWPGKGSRDRAYMALSGGLLRAGWHEAGVRAFLEAIAAATGDEEWRKRIKKAGATKEKLADGKEVTGWPRLEQLMGEPGPAVCTLARTWIGLQIQGNGVVSETSRVTHNAKAKYIPLPAWKPFPVDCLPAPWAEFCRQGAAALHCDPSYVALPTLSVLAGAIGNTRRVYVGPEWFEPAVCWTCVVGESGTIKSPAADLPVNLVKARQKRLMAEYRLAVKVFKKDLADWKRNKGTGKGKDDGKDDGKGKGKDEADDDDRPTPPVLKRVLVSDITIEKLSGILDDNRRGLLAYRDELAGWFGSFQRYKGKSGGSDEPNWLSIYRADAIIYDRKTGDKTSIYVPHAAVSVGGSIQPKTLSRMIGQESFDSGLVARVMFAYPPRTPKQWSDRTIAPEVKAAAEASIDKLYGYEAEVDDDGDPRPVLVKMTRDARDRFKRFVNEWGRRQFQADDELAAALAKLEGMAARFALIHHVTQAAVLEDTDPIGLASIEAGITLAEWAAAEAERVYMMLGETEMERDVRRLVDLVRRVADRNGGRATVKQLQRANQRKYRHKEDAEADLERLVGLGLGRWEEIPAGPKGGRPTRAFVLCVTRDDSDQTPDGDDRDDEGGVSDDTPDRPGPGSGGEGDVPAANPTHDSGSGTDRPEPEPVESETSRVTQSVEAENDPPFRPEPTDASVGGNVTQPRVEVTPTPYVLVTSPDALPTSAVEESVRVGLDVETTGLDPHTDKVRLLSLDVETTDGGRQVYLIDCFKVDPAPLWEPLSRTELVIHNAAFDLSFLARMGFAPSAPVRDTMILSRVLWAGAHDEKHTLAETANRYLRRTLNKTEQRSDWSGTLTADQIAYAAEDAAVLVPLLDAMTATFTTTAEHRVRDEGTVRTADLEARCTPALAWMARTGVALDAAAWRAVADDAKAAAKTLVEQMDAIAPPNADGGLVDRGWKWSSPQQIAAAFKALGIEIPDTSDETLATIDHPLAGLIRRHREQTKLATTYGGAWVKKHVRPDGRVYPSWNQLGAASGRMSCSDPNLQQIPRDERYRRCVVAPAGRVLVKADYSQIELRVAAKVAGDRKMLAAYQRGDDLHALTAKAILGKTDVTKADRQLAKAINFGLLFGMGYKSLVTYAKSNYGVELTPGQAKAYRAAFFTEYPGLARWHETVKKELNRSGSRVGTWYHTRTTIGRRRTMPTHAKRADGTLYPNINEALNSPVQGTAADGLKAALALLWERRAECPSAVPVMAVHDEIVVECNEPEADAVKTWLKTAMTNGMAPMVAPVPVEVEVSIGRTWAG